MIDPVNFEMHDLTVNNCWFTGDNDQIVSQISKFHKFIVTDYFDHNEETKKLKHYQLALKNICDNQNIKLININWNFAGIDYQGRHPTKEEHKLIADKIYKVYYENKFNQ